MRTKTFFLLIFLSALVSFTGCKRNTGNSSKRNITGRAGELIVVVSKDVWSSEAGTTIKEILTQPQLGLPQSEPIFNLINIPKEAFADILKTNRNLIITEVNSSVTNSEVKLMSDVYAYPQAVVTISAKNEQELGQLFKQNSDKIIAFFLKAERDRLMQNYANYHEKVVSKKVKERFGININVAPGFIVAVDKPDFMWFRNETNEISQGICIYSYPYESDSTFTENYLRVKRDLMMKKNVLGPMDGSFMTTEKDFPLLFNTSRLRGNFSAEIRGLWTIENDFMGGPFINLSILDMLKKRVITIDGFIYAPSKDKRNLLRQIEAMIYSIEFDDQKDMDKLNKQFQN